MYLQGGIHTCKRYEYIKQKMQVRVMVMFTFLYTKVIRFRERFNLRCSHLHNRVFCEQRKIYRKLYSSNEVVILYIRSVLTCTYSTICARTMFNIETIYSFSYFAFDWIIFNDHTRVAIKP